jgi:hypothetical protein
MRAWKVRGLTLFRVGTLWRYGDGLFFEVPPLASDALLTTLHPLLKFLVSELPFPGWKGPEIAWGGIWIEFCVRLGKSGLVKPHQNIRHKVKISPHAISGLFQPRKGSSEARNFEVINSLQHVFEKWVERCRKCITCWGRYFEKETITVPLQNSDSE